MKFSIHRTYEEKGTPGRLYDESGTPIFYTIERSSTGDHPCVPEGTYVVSRYDSPSHGKNTWQLDNVPDRTHIQIHIANWPHELLGCIAPGEKPARNITGEPGVSSSRIAYENFMRLTRDQEFIVLTIKSDPIGLDKDGWL